MRGRPLLLGLGWALHVVWDVGIHLGVGRSYIGLWYPLLCVPVDLVVAGYVVAGLSGGSRGRGEAPPAFSG